MIELEAGTFPLVLLDMGRAGRKPEEVRGMFFFFHDAKRRAIAEKVHWVLVAVTADVPHAVERKIIAEESNTFSASDLEYCAASVLVIPNGIVRAAMTALSWMNTKMAPLAAAPTTSAAVDIAVERLRAVGTFCPNLVAVRAKQWFQRNGIERPAGPHDR